MARLTARRLEDARERLRNAETDIANYNPRVDVSVIVAEREKVAAVVSDLR